MATATQTTPGADNVFLSIHAEDEPVRSHSKETSSSQPDTRSKTSRDLQAASPPTPQPIAAAPITHSTGEEGLRAKPEQQQARGPDFEVIFSDPTQQQPEQPTVGLQEAASLPDSLPVSVAARQASDQLPAPEGGSSAPQQGLPAPEERKEAAQQEAASSSLQPATPPLPSPSGASPASRPASVEEGEEPRPTAARQLQPQEQDIAESIRKAIESRISIWEVRRHPPDAMEDRLPPGLRVVSAEIETPGHSPRDDEDGVVSPGLAAAGSGDSFTAALRHHASRLRNAVMSQRVNFLDVARNPRLAKAARAELVGATPPGASPIFSASGAHSAEVERHRAALEGVDAEAEEESGLNRELAAQMTTRLDAARRAAEKLLGVLQACAGAEGAYTRAMTAASRVPLVGDGDGASLRAALSGLSDLPFMVGQAHVTVGAGLSDATKGAQEVVSSLRTACVETGQEAARVHRAIDGARRHLHAAFAEHQAACRASDAAGLERARGRAARPFSDIGDPWLGEARLVAAHGGLQRAQAAERSFLAAAFSRVAELEAARVNAVRDVVGAFAVAYSAALAFVKADTEPLLRTAEGVDAHADLAELAASSAAAAESGAALGTRQADALEAAAQELLCSPEIIRQGEMARWVSGSGKWTDCHFVLTRCGFLHWFNNSPPTPADIVPADSLNLSRCQFETGEAPEFNLVEVSAGMFGRSRRLIFKASSVEECCEWAIVLRESIAECREK